MIRMVLRVGDSRAVLRLAGSARYRLVYECRGCGAREVVSRSFGTVNWLEAVCWTDAFDAAVEAAAPLCPHCRVRFRIGAAYQRRHRLTRIAGGAAGA